MPVSEVRRFEAGLREYFRASHADLLEEIRTTGALPSEEKIDKAMETYLAGFDMGDNA